MVGLGLKPTQRETHAGGQCSHLTASRGEWLSTKKDPEKENSMRIGVGWGQGQVARGQVEMVFVLLEGMSFKTNNALCG